MSMVHLYYFCIFTYDKGRFKEKENYNYQTHNNPKGFALPCTPQVTASDPQVSQGGFLAVSQYATSHTDDTPRQGRQIVRRFL